MESHETDAATNLSSRPPANETTALLSGQKPRKGGKFKPSWPPAHESSRFSLKKEVSSLTALAFPLTLSNFLEHSLTTAAVFWVARISKQHLAAASLASLTINVVCFSVLQGVASALDTLCTQAFASERPTDTSLHAMRTGLIMLVCAVPQCLLIVNVEPLLLLLKQESEIASLTASYLRAMVWAVPGFGLFEVLRKYVVSQGHADISTMIVTFIAPLNVLLNWFFVWCLYSEPWLNGAAYATAFSFNLMALLMLAATTWAVPRTAWGGFHRSILRHWEVNLELAVDGVVSVASEWWIFELCSLAASFLDASHFATQSVLLILSDTVYNAALAASTAASVRVGNYIGGHHPQHARMMARVALWGGLVLGVISAAILWFGRFAIADKLNNDAEVHDLILGLLPWVCTFVLFDSTSAICEGILRGADRPGTAATCSLASYYLGTVPIGAFLAFGPLKMGLVGLWIGLIAAVVFETVVLGSVVLNSEMSPRVETPEPGPGSLLSGALRSSLITPRTPR